MLYIYEKFMYLKNTNDIFTVENPSIALNSSEIISKRRYLINIHDTYLPGNCDVSVIAGNEYGDV